MRTSVMGRPAYLFDMDGVLVDNCRYHVLSWLEFARRRGGRHACRGHHRHEHAGDALGGGT